MTAEGESFNLEVKKKLRQGNYLSEIFDGKELKKGSVNLITVKTGQGKTTAALSRVPDVWGFKRKERILYLAPTTNLRDCIINDYKGQEWYDGIDNKIICMTYSAFGRQVRNGNLNVDMFDYIVADELHRLIINIGIDKGKIPKDYDAKLKAMVLLRTSDNYYALRSIAEWAEFHDILVLGLTATPNNIARSELRDVINEIEIGAALISYETLNESTYTDLRKIILAFESKPDDGARIFFIGSAKEVKKYVDFQKQFLPERKCIGLWSPNNQDHPLTGEQLKVIKKIQKTKEIPTPYQDIYTTEFLGEGNDIYTPINVIVNHTSNKTAIEQHIGRARGQDHNYVLNYDLQGAKNERKKKEKGKNYKIPKKYLDKWLTKGERDRLIMEINFPRKWGSLKKWLEENNFLVEKDTHGNCIIKRTN